MKSFLITIFFSCFSIAGFCASGESIYKFLTLPNSSGVSALGGANVSLQNKDIGFVYQNPALLSGSVHKNIGVNYVNYISDINYGSITYAQDIDSLSHWSVGVNYLHYGSFDGYTEEEIPTGSFSAGDLCLSAVYSRRLAKNFMAGIAIKPIYSYIESYHSFGLAVDVGANYYLPEHDFSVGLVVKNFGVQFKGYYSEDGSQHRESLPWDIQLGITKRLAHAPLRFSVTYVGLNRWNLDYYKQSTSGSFLTDDKDKGIGWGDMLLRHFVIGAEFIPSNNFYISAAYNHRRSREFSLENKKSINGFSFGAGFRVYRFSLGFAYAQYAASGNTITISLTASLDSLK